MSLKSSIQLNYQIGCKVCFFGFVMSFMVLISSFRASAQAPNQEDSNVKRLYFKNAVPLKLPTQQAPLPRATSKNVLPTAPAFSAAKATTDTCPGKLIPSVHSPRKALLLKMPLQGGVTMNVPRTSGDVGKYLKHMRTVISQYEQVASATLLSGNRSKIDPASLRAAKEEALDVIQRIRSTVPPAQLTQRHNELAGTLAAVADFMENPGSGAKSGIEALANISPLLQRLHNTLAGYHTGVKNCISYYHLGNEYDPFAGENEETKTELSGMLSNMKTNLLQRHASESSDGPSNSLSGLGDSMGGLDANSLSGLLGTMGNNSQPATGGGGLDPSALGALLGTLGGSNQTASGAGGGIDLNSLGGLLGILGGNSASGDSNECKSSIDFSKLGGLERLGGLSSQASSNLAGSELETFNELSGSTNNSNSDFSSGLKVDPTTMEQFGNLLKQFQGQ